MRVDTKFIKRFGAFKDALDFAAEAILEIAIGNHDRQCTGSEMLYQVKVKPPFADNWYKAIFRANGDEFILHSFMKVTPETIIEHFIVSAELGAA